MLRHTYLFGKVTGNGKNYGKMNTSVQLSEWVHEIIFWRFQCSNIPGHFRRSKFSVLHILLCPFLYDQGQYLSSQSDHPWDHSRPMRMIKAIGKWFMVKRVQPQGAPFSSVGRVGIPCAEALSSLRVTPPLSHPVSCHIAICPVNKAI